MTIHVVMSETSHENINLSSSTVSALVDMGILVLAGETVKNSPNPIVIRAYRRIRGA